MSCTRMAFSAEDSEFEGYLDARKNVSEVRLRTVGPIDRAKRLQIEYCRHRNSNSSRIGRDLRTVSETV